MFKLLWAVFTLQENSCSISARITEYSRIMSTCFHLHHLAAFFFQSQVTLTLPEMLKNIAVEGGASSLQSVELQVSLEEMMELY